MRWLLLTAVIVSAVIGDLLQSREMKEAANGGENLKGAAGILRMIWRRRPLALSILCMAVSFFAFLALVQREPLSFAVPASAGTFILETLLARFVLREHIGALRAAGTVFVLAGIILISR